MVPSEDHEKEPGSAGEMLNAWRTDTGSILSVNSSVMGMDLSSTVESDPGVVARTAGLSDSLRVEKVNRNSLCKETPFGSSTLEETLITYSFPVDTGRIGWKVSRVPAHEKSPLIAEPSSVSVKPCSAKWRSNAKAVWIASLSMT